MLIAGCELSPAHLEHVHCFTSFRLHFGGVLRGGGRFVPRTCFDRVPAGTVLAETQLFRTRSDYKKWCVPRTCSRWNCTENKCERPESCIKLLYELIFSRWFYFREFRESNSRENFHFNLCLFIVMTTSAKPRN